MKNQVNFKYVSERVNGYVIEPVYEGYESSFDGRDEAELDRRLDELREHYEHLTGVPVDAINVTMLLSRGDHIESYPLSTGGMADDICDIRRQVQLPDGIDFADCRFFVLYPNKPEDTEAAMQWLVLLPVM